MTKMIGIFIKIVTVLRFDEYIVYDDRYPVSVSNEPIFFYECW